MTLHEAIEIVIKEQGKALTPSEISIHINKKKLYQKSGNRPINIPSLLVEREIEYWE